MVILVGPMPNRPPAPDSLVDAEIARAEADVAPGRLMDLDAAYALTPPQCLNVGKALASVAQAHYDEHCEDEESEDDPDDELEERVVHAAVLQIIGGEKWVLEADYSRTLTRGESLSYRIAVGTIHGWAYGGSNRLLEPAEVTLPWPDEKGRDCALRLAEGLLPSLLLAVDEEPELVRTLEETLQKARAEVDLGDARRFAALRERLLSGAVARIDRGEAARAAEAAKTNEALNRAAYLSHLTGLVFQAIAAALEARPNFEAIFGARVGMGYARFALEHELDGYYSTAAAGFDELSTMDEERQAEVASREIHALVDEAIGTLHRAGHRR